MNELEFVFKKIIEIDNKATDLQSNTKKTIENMDAELLEKLKSFDSQLKEDTKAKLEQKYKHSMNMANKQAQQILEDADQQCKNIMDHYSKVKDRLKDQLLNELIQS